MSNDLVLVSREKVKELIGAMRSVNRGRQYEVRPPVDDEPCYWQRREWVEWGIKVAEDLDADIQRRNSASSELWQLYRAAGINLRSSRRSIRK
ncbi:TPA: hypothetical protein ACVGJS_003630 [Pseudomonas aeruginosa]